jgi:cytochrome P450
LAAPDPLAVLRAWAAQYGDIFHYRAFWTHVYFLNHPDYIEYVLLRNHRNFVKHPALRNVGWLLGQGLLTSEGELWKRQRRLIQPAFHRDCIAGFAEIMTSCTKQTLGCWRAGADVDMHREMMQLTLRIVIRCLFGIETDQTAEISRGMDLLMRQSTGLRLLLPSWLRGLLPGTGEVRPAARALNRAVCQIIGRRRTAGEERGDLLGLLLAARDEDGECMSDRQIRDEVMTFFFAGHETTALALSWTFYLLSRNPDAERKLHEELDRVVGRRTPALTDLPALAWTDSIIKEALRVCPPAWAVGRVAIRDFELAGYRIPKGSVLVMSPWIMQRDARYFPDPENFNPSRWANSATPVLPRFAYFPFGGGPRQCIGNNFALMEAILLLATIAQQFEIHIDPAESITPVAGFTLRPRKGMPARIAERVRVPSGVASGHP